MVNRSRLVGLSLGLAATLCPLTRASAKDEIIASCRLGQGHSFYAPSSAMSGKDAGWQNDGWKSDASRLLLLRNGKKYNLVTRDAIGTKSANADGAEVLRLASANPSVYQIASIYPAKATVEVFTFVMNAKGGGGQMLWTSARTGGSFIGPKVGAYVGQCD
jgi:hypothetical protein